MQIKSADNKDKEKLILCGLLISVAFIYYPGLNSRFLLDDFYNLAGLGEVSRNGIFYYVLGGFAGPSGRPLSLLSFVLQYSHWPANPFAFKLVNLVIHLVNGVLIWFICKRLFRTIETDEKLVVLFTFLITALWLLHPIQLSTVLYTVQRMTELSTLFMLIGILGYLYSRDLFRECHSRRSIILMSLFVLGGTCLAVLCKEIGILLPLFILVIELTLFSNQEKNRLWIRWAWLCLVLPLLILVIYLVLNLDSAIEGYQTRDYTYLQRLMTEPGVLLVYLKNLILPAYGTFTLYHDDYPVSQGLLTPPYTLISIVALVCMLIVGLIYRKRLPILSFALLWYFSGHLLESTYLNLELYYEHRNYLPSLGIFFLMAFVMIKLLKQVKEKLVIYSVIAIIYLQVIVVTIIEVRIWSQPVIQSIEWARLHPKSVSAKNDLATLHIHSGNYDKVYKIYNQIDALQPGNIYTSIQNIRIRNCKQDIEMNNVDFQSVILKAESAKPHGLRVIAGLDLLIADIMQGQCNKLGINNITELLSSLISNPEFSFMRGFLYEFLATVKLFEMDYPLALYNIREAIKYSPKPDNYIYEIRVLNILGEANQVKEKIIKFKEKFHKNPKYFLAYDRIIKSLELTK